jgi:hypothetical protein
VTTNQRNKTPSKQSIESTALQPPTRHQPLNHHQIIQTAPANQQTSNKTFSDYHESSTKHTPENSHQQATLHQYTIQQK